MEKTPPTNEQLANEFAAASAKIEEQKGYFPQEEKKPGFMEKLKGIFNRNKQQEADYSTQSVDDQIKEMKGARESIASYNPSIDKRASNIMNESGNQMTRDQAEFAALNRQMTEEVRPQMRAEAAQAQPAAEQVAPTPQAGEADKFGKKFTEELRDESGNFIGTRNTTYYKENGNIFKTTSDYDKNGMFQGGKDDKEPITEEEVDTAYRLHEQHKAETRPVGQVPSVDSSLTAPTREAAFKAVTKKHEAVPTKPFEAVATKPTEAVKLEMEADTKQTDQVIAHPQEVLDAQPDFQITPDTQAPQSEVETRPTPQVEAAPTKPTTPVSTEPVPASTAQSPSESPSELYSRVFGKDNVTAAAEPQSQPEAPTESDKRSVSENDYDSILVAATFRKPFKLSDGGTIYKSEQGETYHYNKGDEYKIVTKEEAMAMVQGEIMKPNAVDTSTNDQAEGTPNQEPRTAPLEAPAPPTVKLETAPPGVVEEAQQPVITETPTSGGDSDTPNQFTNN